MPTGTALASRAARAAAAGAERAGRAAPCPACPPSACRPHPVPHLPLPVLPLSSACPPAPPALRARSQRSPGAQRAWSGCRWTLRPWRSTRSTGGEGTGRRAGVAGAGRFQPCRIPRSRPGVPAGGMLAPARPNWRLRWAARTARPAVSQPEGPWLARPGEGGRAASLGCRQWSPASSPASRPARQREMCCGDHRVCRRHPCPPQGRWNWVAFNVPSSPNHYLIDNLPAALLFQNTRTCVHREFKVLYCINPLHCCVSLLILSAVLSKG